MPTPDQNVEDRTPVSAGPRSTLALQGAETHAQLRALAVMPRIRCRDLQPTLQLLGIAQNIAIAVTPQARPRRLRRRCLRTPVEEAADACRPRSMCEARKMRAAASSSENTIDYSSVARPSFTPIMAIHRHRHRDSLSEHTEARGWDVGCVPQEVLHHHTRRRSSANSCRPDNTRRRRFGLHASNPGRAPLLPGAVLTAKGKKKDGHPLDPDPSMQRP